MRYLRFNTFRRAMAPVSRRARQKRMAIFIEAMSLAPGTRILDLGGAPDTWRPVDIPLDITILNLPGIVNTDSTPPQHEVRYIEGDACNAAGLAPGDFDVVYSNSVIEHVGPESRQRAFASEVLRLGPRYWVQTPSKWFPIEAHCGMPYWWFYPESLRHRILEGWRKKLPAWTEMVEGTRVLSFDYLQELFPGASSYTEWLAGFPKSYAMYSTG